MPDISMCPNDSCPLRFRCRRHEASGTIAKSLNQSYIAYAWRAGPVGPECDDFWDRTPDVPPPQGPTPA